MQEKEQQEVNDIKLFLEKSEYGTGQVYQLHRKLGGVFLDASFHDDKYLFTCRVSIYDPPKHISSELMWDEYGFPYELETYKIASQEVKVKLYRSFDEVRAKAAFIHFLEDVVQEIDTRDDTPKDLLEGVVRIKNTIGEISTNLGKIDDQLKLTEEEKKAVDTFFGGSGIWNHKQFMEEDLHLALTEYVFGFIQKHSDLYKEIKNKETEIRQTSLRSMESELVQKYTELLEQHGFKRGYITNQQGGL